MTELQDALKSLSPMDWDDVPRSDLKSYMNESFADAQLLIDSIPIPEPAGSQTAAAGRPRSDTGSSVASSASEISQSSARATPPKEDVEALQKLWGKPIKLAAKENPLGMSVYKLAGKDGKGAWFARRSVHEGLGFSKWKKALEAEFPETMKTQGGPGEGNIRGIGGEKRVEFEHIDGLGKLEVYHLSAQFPGPTTPRDFVTLLLTSDSALSEHAGGTEDGEIPRHFMVVSKPCIHPECPERGGFIRGQYQSVEFIREIPVKKLPKKSASTTDLAEKTHSRNRSTSSLGKEAIMRNANRLQHSSETIGEGEVSVPSAAMASDTEIVTGDGRARGKTISYDTSRGHGAKGEQLDTPHEDDELETNPIEWIMLTRSDPGGSVPRFMIERGTPGGIVGDASKFLDWACAADMQDLEDTVPSPKEAEEDAGTSAPAPASEKDHHEQHHREELPEYKTNGHLAGLESTSDKPEQEATNEEAHGALYNMVAGAAGMAEATLSAYTPAVIRNHLPGLSSEGDSAAPAMESRRYSTSSSSSSDSFASAKEGSPSPPAPSSPKPASLTTVTSATVKKVSSQQEKELEKLEDKKRKLDEKLQRERTKELNKKNDDSEKEAAALAKVEEKHSKEVAKQEEKYKKEVEKLEHKKRKEAHKAAERQRKALEKDERVKLSRELDEVRADLDVVRKERDILRSQVGDLQAENTALAAQIGRMGSDGVSVLGDVRKEVEASGNGRIRADSLRFGASKRPDSVRSSESLGL